VPAVASIDGRKAGGAREVQVSINPYYVALGGAILVGVGAQVMLKLGALASDSLVAQFSRASTIGGLVLYLASAMLYVVALRKMPLAVAFPTVSLGYVLIAVIDHFAFKEALGLAQLGGLVLIMAGVGLLHHHAS
jgi:small multidrug resistance pump